MLLIAAMFSKCSVFNSDLSSWDVSNVTNTLAMFSNCGVFNSDLSSWNVSNVTNMRGMFDCNAVVYLIVIYRVGM